MGTAWVPGLLLITLGAGHYGDEAMASATGWPIEWAYAICQAGAQAVLWVLVVALVPRTLLLIPGVIICTVGAAESLMRAGGLVLQQLAPIAVPDGANLLDARTGLDLYAWGLAMLSVCASTLAAWATAEKQQ